MSQESRYALVDGRRYIHKYDVTSVGRRRRGDIMSSRVLNFFADIYLIEKKMHKCVRFPWVLHSRPENLKKSRQKKTREIK